MTTALKRTGAALLTLLMFCVLTLGGTYTLTLPVKQVTKLNVTGYLSGLTIGDVTYTGTLTGDIEKGNGILTIKNLPASVLTGSEVGKALTVTCNIQMDLSLLGEINTTARMCIWAK